MLIGRNRGHFFIILLSTRAKLLTPDWSSGENTCSRLTEHAISTFLHFVPQQQRLLSGSLDFVQKKTWKLSATAKREVLKVNFRFLQEAAKDYLCEKQKT